MGRQRLHGSQVGLETNSNHVPASDDMHETLGPSMGETRPRLCRDREENHLY